jgi:hypothetical protein
MAASLRCWCRLSPQYEMMPGVGSARPVWLPHGPEHPILPSLEQATDYVIEIGRPPYRTTLVVGCSERAGFRLGIRLWGEKTRTRKGMLRGRQSGMAAIWKSGASAPRSRCLGSTAARDAPQSKPGRSRAIPSTRGRWKSPTSLDWVARAAAATAVVRHGTPMNRGGLGRR